MIYTLIGALRQCCCDNQRKEDTGLVWFLTSPALHNTVHNISAPEQKAMKMSLPDPDLAAVCDVYCINISLSISVYI